MKTEKQQVRKNCKGKLAGGVFAKLLLLVFSFVQTYWVPIACAAGTVAAATMFGEKGYMAKLAEESQTMLKEGKTADAVKLLESKISEYLTWRENNLKNADTTDMFLPDLYYQLAKVKEATGASANGLAENYKKAIFSSNGGSAFAWLYKNLTSQEYAELVKNYIESMSADGSKMNIGSGIAEQFEKGQNWPAFKAFLQVVFDRSKEPVVYARAFEQGLNKDGALLKEYVAYCKTRPDLLEYVSEKDYELAEKYKKEENFAKAAEVYESILKASGSEKDTSQLKLTICDTLFNAGEYQQAISKLDTFITEHKATHRALVKDATLMKGRAYIQLGEVGKASDVFFTLVIEYPETKQAPEANFFIGYCYMLQGKFDQAKEALNLVVTDYPQSSYVSKAKLCLTRIEGMIK